jgi:hypothetical protein
MMFETKERDKYGRTVRHFGTELFRTKVVVVTLPKMAAENHNGNRYLVNDWQMPVWDNGEYVGDAPGKITYLPTLKVARELAASKM